MPRLRPVSLGGLPWLELVRLSGDDGWHYGVLNGRKEIGRLTHLPGVDPGGPGGGRCGGGRTGTSGPGRRLCRHWRGPGVALRSGDADPPRKSRRLRSCGAGGRR
jgi:hypothetical protein